MLDYLPKVDSYGDAVKFIALIKDDDLSPLESAFILSALLAAFQSMIEETLSLYYFEEIPAFARTEQGQARAREVLLDRITPATRPTIVEHIARALVAIGITDDDRTYLRQMVLERLDAEDNPYEIHSLMQIISHLSLETEMLEHAQARCHQTALQWLADDDKAYSHEVLLRVLRLAGATEEQRNALRNMLLKRAAESTRIRALNGFLPSLVDPCPAPLQKEPRHARP